MKKILMLFLVLPLILKCIGQIPSSCVVPPQLAIDYNDDVHFLAMQRIYEIQSPDTIQFTIPQIYKDSIWEAFAAIYNINTPERDSVFCLYNVHQNLNIYSVTILVDTSFNWTDQWQNLQTITGYTQLDNLISQYGFSISYFSSFSSIARINTTQQININRFNDSLLEFNGILAASSNVYGDGDKLYYSLNGNVKQLGFGTGCDDCPSICISRNIRSFYVFPDCSVEYSGFQQFGPSFCQPTFNCNLTSIEGLSKNTNIFPNPTSSNITLNTDLKNGELKIYNALGELLHQSSIVNSQSQINVSSFANGIHYLHLQSDEGVTVKKFEVLR